MNISWWFQHQMICDSEVVGVNISLARDSWSTCALIATAWGWLDWHEQCSRILQVDSGEVSDFPKKMSMIVNDCPRFIFKVAQPPRNSLLATGARGVSGVALVPLWTQPLKVWGSWKICMKPVYLAGKSMFVRFPQKRPSGDVINGQEKLSVSSRRMKRTPCAATCEMTLSRTTPTWRSAFLAGVELEF